MKKIDNGVNNVEKLQNKSIDELRSESSNAEREYMKHLNNNTNDENNTNVDNNNNNNHNNVNDDTHDGKIRDEISDIRMILSRLGTIITNKDKKKIKKELYEIEKKQNLLDKEKEKNYDNLVELVRILDKKRKIQIL